MANDKEFEAFIRQIDGLNIEISKSSDGVLTVCSSAEPLFCYDGDTPEELQALVADTFASYARHFFSLEGLEVKSSITPIEYTIPVEHSTPVSRVTPHFDLAA